MTTSEFKSKIDKLWEKFWTGGITNPLTVIEQITFLLFCRLLDIAENQNENKEKRTGKPEKRIFGKDDQDIRWSKLKHNTPEEKLEKMRDRVFPHFKKASINGSHMGEYMKDAQLMIVKPSLMHETFNMVDELPLTGDTKGDLYEFLLSKLTTAGINGQFRTPRHIIRFMAEMVDPKMDEIIADPACGTGGFLAGTMEHILRSKTSPGFVTEYDGGGKTYAGDQLTDEEWNHIKKDMFTGFDFDSTMLRTAAMNLILHGVDTPSIYYQDTMSGNFIERFPSQAQDHFDVILANPPFKGSLDFEDVSNTLLSKIKTKKTELLFIALILRMLKSGGRSAAIVPDGVLFGSSKAHVALRKLLIDENQLEAVISLPSGVFKPYAGVSTAILVFTKSGETKDVFFYDVQADGRSLDDKRAEVGENDLEGPDGALQRWRERDSKIDTDRKKKYFCVPVDEIREKKYDLSISIYKEIVYEEEPFDPPKEILGKMKALEDEIQKGLDELEGMLQ